MQSEHYNSEFYLSHREIWGNGAHVIGVLHSTSGKENSYSEQLKVVIL